MTADVSLRLFKSFSLFLTFFSFVASYNSMHLNQVSSFFPFFRKVHPSTSFPVSRTTELSAPTSSSTHCLALPPYFSNKFIPLFLCRELYSLVTIESQSVVDVTRIMVCNRLRPVETAAMKCWDNLRHSSTCVTEIEIFYLCDTLQHSETFCNTLRHSATLCETLCSIETPSLNHATSEQWNLLGIVVNASILLIQKWLPLTKKAWPFSKR